MRNKTTNKAATTDATRYWVTLPRYCENTGDTKDAVHARRKKGIWRDGVETCVGPNNRVWVCPEAASQWVESGMAVTL